MTETVFTNARVVLADRVIDGSVLIRSPGLTVLPATS